VRPIITIAGDDELSESFFDNVEVPAENLVGALQGGWAIANDLLSHERLSIANPQYALEAISRIEAIGRSNGMIDDPVFQDRLAGLRIKIVAQAAMFSHAVGLMAKGRHLGAEASILKLVATDNLQAITDFLVETAGCHGANRHRQPVADGDVDVTEIFLQSRRASIYGGSSEILRNVVARRVLNLPS
jgi:alkylation response protein AidB-like acyl-CoA dehydrogenase